MLKIALVQSPLFWHDAEKNRQYFSSCFNAKEKAQLWVLPEMFTTGFTQESALVAETMEGETVTWLKNEAQKHQTAICGSVVISENGKFYNRLLLAQKNGSIAHYDKRHLFTMANEHLNFSSGAKNLVVDIEGVRVAFQVCYDLRFPVFTRNSRENTYDLLIYVANWPEVRITAWDKLLCARAIENQCFVAGVNRVGTDNNGIQYNGHSTLIDPLGTYLIPPFETEHLVFKTIDLGELNAFRQRFPVLNDADSFTLL